MHARTDAHAVFQRHDDGDEEDLEDYEVSGGPRAFFASCPSTHGTFQQVEVGFQNLEKNVLPKKRKMPVLTEEQLAARTAKELSREEAFKAREQSKAVKAAALEQRKQLRAAQLLDKERPRRSNGQSAKVLSTALVNLMRISCGRAAI